MSILPLQAGLTVGDLILAVNKDTLLGSTYDAVSIIINFYTFIMFYVGTYTSKIK